MSSLANCNLQNIVYVIIFQNLIDRNGHFKTTHVHKHTADVDVCFTLSKYEYYDH